MVTLKVGDQNIDFMVDTGAELSVVTKPVAPLSEKTTAVTGVSGEEMIKSVSDQIRSVSQSCPTLCDPMNRSTPGLPDHHQLPEFTETHVHRVSDAIQPSHPLSSSSPPASPEDVIWRGREGHQVIHEFLYIPECPVRLLGRDLLSKLGARVTFSPEERPTFRMNTMTYLLSQYHPKMSGGCMSFQRKN